MSCYAQLIGGHIDHAYWKDENEVWQVPRLERYSPYYSKHDGLFLTLIINVRFIEKNKHLS